MIRVATYNVGDGPDSAKIADFKIIAAHADVIGLQEASDRGHAITGFVREDPEWWAWLGDGSDGAAAVPILYRRDLGRVTGKYSTTCVGPTELGDPGAGPDHAKAKVANRIRVTIPGYGLAHFVNSHMIPSVTRPNLPNIEKRRAHYRKHVHAVANIVHHRAGLVFYTVDDNAPEDYDLLHPYHAEHMAQEVHGATHHDAKIDHIYLRQRKLHLRSRLVVDNRRIWAGLSSDHNAATITWRAA